MAVATAFTAARARAQNLPEADPWALPTVGSFELVHRTDDVDVRLHTPSYLALQRLGAVRDPRRLLGALRLTAQTDYAWATASIWGSALSLRIPPVLCLQPTLGGGTPLRLQAGVRYACHGLKVGSEISVSGDRTRPGIVGFTTREFASYATPNYDVGVSHFTDWLARRVTGQAPQFLSATAGVRSAATGPSVRASTLIPLSRAPSFSNIAATGQF